MIRAFENKWNEAQKEWMLNQKWQLNKVSQEQLVNFKLFKVMLNHQFLLKNHQLSILIIECQVKKLQLRNLQLQQLPKIQALLNLRHQVKKISRRRWKLPQTSLLKKWTKRKAKSNKMKKDNKNDFQRFWILIRKHQKMKKICEE